MSTEAVTAAISALLALPAGWFACVLTERIPGNEPLFRPLVPVRLHGRWLVIQGVTIVGFVAMALRFSESWWVVAPYLVLVIASVALSAIDLEHLRLPDRIVAPTLLIAVPMITVSSIATSNAVAIQRAFIGLATYFGFLFLFHLIFGNRGMGFGDVKMAAILGLYLGWIATNTTEVIVMVLWALIIGVFGGAIIGIVLFIVRGRSQSYPFGPFLIGGTMVIILWGQSILP